MADANAASIARRRRNSLRGGTSQGLAIALAARDVKPPPLEMMGKAVVPEAQPVRPPPPVRRAAPAQRKAPPAHAPPAKNVAELSGLIYELRGELARVTRERDSLRADATRWEADRDIFFKRISSNPVLRAQGLPDGAVKYVAEENPEIRHQRVLKVGKHLLARWQRRSLARGLAGWEAIVSARVRTRKLVNHCVGTWLRARLRKGMRSLIEHHAEILARQKRRREVVERTGRRWRRVLQSAAFARLADEMAQQRAKEATLRNTIAVRLRVNLQQRMALTTDQAFVRWRAVAAEETLTEVGDAHRVHTEALVSAVVAALERVRAGGSDAEVARDEVSFLLCTVIFYANLAHNLTRSP